MGGRLMAPNKSAQATAAARFRFLSFLVFIRSFCRTQSLSAAVPDFYRWTYQPEHD